MGAIDAVFEDMAPPAAARRTPRNTDSWLARAGFATEEDAARAGCNRCNSWEFRDGQRTEQGGALAAPSRAGRKLDLLALSAQKAPERHWFVPGWLGPFPNLCAGKGGMGKSTVVQQVATAGAAGRAFLGPQTPAFRSLVVNCEDEHDELWRKQERICELESIAMSDTGLVDNLHIVSRYGCDNALMALVQGQLLTTPFFEELREQVNDLQVDVLWLDNAAHLLLGNHDDRTHVTAFINAISGLVTGRPFAPVIVAHPGKAQGSEYSGSVAWENAVRSRWYLGDRLPDEPLQPGEDDSADRSKVRFLCRRKANYSAQDFVRFTMQEGLLVPDHNPQQTTSGIVAMLDERRAEEVCIAGFHSLRGMGLLPTDSKQAADYLPKQIVAKRLSAGYTANDLAKAMHRLMAAGKFSRGPVGKYPNRTPRLGLVFQDVQ